MSILTTAKFGYQKNNPKTKKTDFEDFFGANFDPIWTEASGFESQRSEKRIYVHVCVHIVGDLSKNST